MAHALSYQTNMSKIQNSNLFTFVATLAGVAIGVMASLAMMGPMVRSEVSSATSGLRTINAKPTDSVTSCVAPSGGASNGASVKTAAAVAPEAGKGGDQGSNPWVNKLVGGGMNTSTATISGNGNGSHNEINTTNKNVTKINNDNNVQVNNTNLQFSGSGDANSQNNYSAGSAASGDSSNSYDSDTTISISN